MGIVFDEEGRLMGKTRRTLIREPDVPPRPKRVKARQCDNCKNWYDPEDIFQDRNDRGEPIGWLCGGCI